MLKITKESLKFLEIEFSLNSSFELEVIENLFAYISAKICALIKAILNFVLVFLSAMSYELFVSHELTCLNGYTYYK